MVWFRCVSHEESERTSDYSHTNKPKDPHFQTSDQATKRSSHQATKRSRGRSRQARAKEDERTSTSGRARSGLKHEAGWQEREQVGVVKREREQVRTISNNQRWPPPRIISSNQRRPPPRTISDKQSCFTTRLSVRRGSCVRGGMVVPETSELHTHLFCAKVTATVSHH